LLVVDANFAVAACTAEDGFREFESEELVAPPLMWPEFRSAVHEAVWRRAVSSNLGRLTLQALDRSPIRAKTHPRLGWEAWRLADELGWAKTYDAEYLALASLLGARVVTLDSRFRRGAERTGLVVTPSEL
jgi:predicted nucleic acid-binding protein